MATSQQDITVLLKKLGFTASGEKRGRFKWSSIRASKSDATPSRTQISRTWQTPFIFKRLSIKLDELGWSLEDLNLELNISQFVRNLTHLAQQYFGQSTRVEVSRSGQGDLWCFFETVQSRGKSAPKTSDGSGGVMQSPHGLSGFKVAILGDGLDLCVQVYDRFGIGVVPLCLISGAMTMVSRALGFVNMQEDDAGLFESRLNIVDVLRSTLESFWGSEDTRNFLRRRTTHTLPHSLLSLSVTAKDLDGNWQIGTTADGFGSRNSFVSGLEVLEERELKGRYGQLDLLMLKGEVNQANDLLGQLIANEPQSLYLWRRKALLDIESGTIRGNPSWDLLASEQETKLLIAFEILRQNIAGNSEKVLDLLSQLGEVLYQDVDGFDALKSVEMVFPEMLGDAWMNIDPGKAEECYLRILEQRGELPRILHKVVETYRRLGDQDQEIVFLNRLLLMEKRKPQLSDIHQRLSVIYALNHQVDQAIQSGLNALNLDPQNVKLARQICHFMVAQHEPRRALQVLQDVGGHLMGEKDRGKRAEIEVGIGLIWFLHLHRRDLAKERFIKAIELSDKSPEILREIEQVVKDQDDPESLVLVLEGAFQRSLDSGNREELRNNLDQLVKLYRDRLHAPEKVLSAYKRWAALYAMDPDEIASVLGWDDVSIEWNSFYQLLIRHLSDIEDTKVLQSYHLRLGEICRFKLLDMAKAAEHFRDALHFGWVEPNVFTFLEDYYLAQRDYSHLMECLKIRVEQVTGNEKLQLLEKMIKLPHGLSDYLKDVYSLQLALLDVSKEDVLKERFLLYEMEQDLDRIDRLVAMIQTEISEAATQRHWVEYALELVAHMTTPVAYEHMARYLSLLEVAATDPLSHHSHAVELLKNASDLSLLYPHIKFLILAGRIPALVEKKILEILKDDSDTKRRYHQIHALSQNDPDLIITHSRLALHADGIDAVSQFKILVRLGKYGALTDSERVLFRTLADENESWDEYIEVLRKQLQFVDSNRLRENLWREILNVAIEKTQDEALTYEVYTSLLHLVTDVASLQFELAAFARQSHDLERGVKYALACLTQDDCWADEQQIEQIIEWLVTEASAHEAVKRIVQPKVEALAKAQEFEKAAWIADLLSQFGIVHTKMAWISLEYHAQSKDFTAALDAWRRLTSLVPDERQALKFLLDSNSLFERYRVGGYLDRMIDHCLIHGFPPDLSLGVEHEIKQFYAKHLFDKEQKPEVAMKLLQELYFNNPADLRLWMPLYFLSKGSGEERLQLDLLERIIVELQHNPSLLASYPITPESLHEELVHLRKKMGVATKKAPQQMQRTRGREQQELEHRAISRPSALQMEQQRFSAVAGEMMPVRRPSHPDKKPKNDRDRFSLIQHDQKIEAPQETALKGGDDLKNNSSSVGQFSMPVDGDTGTRHNYQLHSQEDTREERIPAMPEETVVISSAAEAPQDMLSPSGQEGAETNVEKGPEAEFAPPTSDGADMTGDGAGEPSKGMGVGAFMGQHSRPGTDLYDWRAVIRRGQYFPGMTNQLMNLAFEHETEKHLAIQELALFSGEIEVLESWQFRVWRRPSEYRYPRDLSGRIPREFVHPLINSHHHELIKFLTPVLAFLFQQEFNHQAVTRKLKIKDDELLKRRRPIPWENEFFVNNGLATYRPQLVAKQMNCFDVKGLGRDIHFDVTRREFYIDTSYYRQKPPSFCYHRLLTMVRAIQMNYYVALKLDPIKQIFPVIARYEQILREKKFSQVMLAIGIERDPLKQSLGHLDRDNLQRLISKVSPLVPESFGKLGKVMWNYLYSLELAESLDLIGVIEAARNVEIIGKRPEVIRSMVKDSNQIRFFMKKGMDLLL